MMLITIFRHGSLLQFLQYIGTGHGRYFPFGRRPSYVLPFCRDSIDRNFKLGASTKGHHSPR